GLMRAREFIMKDAYSFHTDKESLDVVYKNLYDAYCRIFERMGLEYTVVEADGGAMASSDSQTHEFQVVAETGEDEIIYCSKTGYAANIEKAKTKRADGAALTGDSMPEDVSTPNASTIDAVAKLLEVEAHHTIKALVYECIKSEVSSVVVAFILGDDTLNEVKIKALTGADHLRPASESMLASAGLIKGFIGPQHLPEKLEVYLDDSIDDHGLYIAGANKVDFHTKNIQPSRDLAHIKKADLRLAKSGDLTLDGKGVVAVRRGIEVGHIFQLGDKYTKAMNVTVSDVNGKPLHPLMGCYGIGITRVAAAAVEQNNDEGGIIWPAAIAPYQVYLASIAKDDEVAKIAEGVYHELQNLGYEVLLDDRKVGPGFKFKDSDLLGLPVRVVVGDKTWKEHQKLELVWRHNGEKLLVSKEELAGVLKAGLKV
ncbi:MAG: proline--tRNA ligase, partial [Bdellovibrionales bacterium CG12_big_fil_rev_8_21_14_0_65_38_15]